MQVKIIVGSLNPVKLVATREAFSNYYSQADVFGLEVHSGVSDQPIDEEAFEGAENRATRLLVLNYKRNLAADFFVGIEGGISKIYDRWFAFGCICIINKHMQKSFGTSAHFELPQFVTERLLNREELGIVMDEIMSAKNTKQKDGAISFFTKGVMNRKELYVPGIISALVPFNHEGMYFQSD